MMMTMMMMIGWEGIKEYESRTHIDTILNERECTESFMSTHIDTFSDIRTVKIVGSSLDDVFISKVNAWILGVHSWHSRRLLSK